jgi:Uma2 family endonuclease
MTVPEFLEWDDGTDRRYELMDGTIVAMAPTTGVHGGIMMNIGMFVGPRLKPPCRVVGDAGIFLPHRNDAFYIADAAISCTPLPLRPGIADPVVIFEILSPSTLRDDLSRKVPDFQEIASVQEIVLISGMARQVDHRYRTAHGWEVRELRGDDVLALHSVGARVSLDMLYDGTGL